MTGAKTPSPGSQSLADLSLLLRGEVCACSVGTPPETSEPTPLPAPAGRGRREGAFLALAAGGECFRAPLLPLLALLFCASPAFGSSPADALAQAGREFAEGVRLRDDSAKARPAFARAAAAYDALWNQGFRTPELAVNRARAHRLAGSLPRSIAALHDGLAIARFSRPLQVELDDARAAVQYPLDGELAQQARPRPLRGVSTRMSPADAWLLAGGLWLVACACAARFAMTRNSLWLASAAIWLAGLLALGWLWYQDARESAKNESLPLLVVTEDATLRRGNAGAYPPRFDSVLPKGAEVRELSRRGGWVQVELPGGAAGWLPEGSVIGCGEGRP